MVSKAGVEESVEIALVKQMAGSPQALGMVSATAIVTGMIPGMPLLAFWTIGAGAGYPVSYTHLDVYKRQAKDFLASKKSLGVQLDFFES